MAVETLSRRADGVMHFVESYRQISRAPEVRRRPIDVLAWGDELQRLFTDDTGRHHPLGIPPPLISRRYIAALKADAERLPPRQPEPTTIVGAEHGDAGDDDATPTSTSAEAAARDAKAGDPQMSLAAFDRVRDQLEDLVRRLEKAVPEKTTKARK